MRFFMDLLDWLKHWKCANYSTPPKTNVMYSLDNENSVTLREKYDRVHPHFTKKRKKRGKRQGRRRWGASTHHHSGSLLPVVMVIRGFGQDYEIFYLVASALLERTSKLTCSMSVVLTPLFLGGKDSVWPAQLQHTNISTSHTCYVGTTCALVTASSIFHHYTCSLLCAANQMTEKVTLIIK